MRAFINKPVAAGIALVALTSSGISQKPMLTAAMVFDTSKLLKVEIEIAKTDWTTLCRQTRTFAGSLGRKPTKRPFTWFKGNVIINGVRIQNVGIRKKGFLGSLDTRRPSLKIKFDEFKKQKPVDGLDRVTLNNNKQDRSLLSQPLGYRLFRAAGVKAPRCNHAELVVNGTSLGVYSNVESIRAPFLERAFKSAVGDLYEGTVADFFKDGVDKFQLKTKLTKRGPIERVAAAMDQPKVDLAKLEKEIDLDAFFTFWAMESLMGFWDGYAHNQNNFYLYRAPTTSKLYFIPWGLDAAFTDTMPLPPYRMHTKSVMTNAMLANRLYQMPPMRARYKKTLESLLAKVWVEKDLETEIARVEALVKGRLHASQKDFGRAVRRVRRFVQRRRRGIERELKDWPVELTKGPKTLFYFEPVGKATGTFSTTWSAAGYKFGKATLELTLNGKGVKFKEIGVASNRSTWPTIDGGPKPPAIIFVGNRASDGKQVSLAITTSIDEFAPSQGQEVVVQGILFEGKLGFLSPKTYRMASGTVKLAKAAMQDGAAVRGTIQVDLARMMGGETTRYAPKDQ